MAPAFPIVYIGQKESKNFSQKYSMTMMSKRKFPMGHPPGELIPDYRHVVETMAESEGFGSSGRVDTEMTLSEDSCSPKRKCISLNGDSHDRFGVPVQVLSFSKMSKSERKDLKRRLRRELEEIRILQNRVTSFNPSAVVLSASSDIRSSSDGKKRPPLEGTPKPPEHPSQRKKRLPPGRNGPRTKKGLVGRVEAPKQVVPVNTSNVMLMKQCENLLSRLMSHQFGWVFNEPVDIAKLKIPDYYTVIKHPMDLGTVKSKLARGEYSSPMGFAADVRRTFSNAMTYNPPGNDVYFMAQTLSKHFDQRWKVIEKKMTNTESQVLPSRKDTQVHEVPVNDQIPPSKIKNSTPVGYIGKSEPVKTTMTNQEKHKLSMELEALLGDLPESIINFLKENSSAAGQTSEDEIEIEIDTLGDDVLSKVRKLLDDFLLEKKQQTKGEQCEMELHNESGLSNSSIQPGKETDAINEDVDIGGSDHPVSSFPPVEIEKDSAHKNGGRSSSSSEAGSSSSDSDSESAHIIEPERRKALQEGHMLQGTLKDGLNLQQNGGDIKQNGGRKQSQNTLSQEAQNPLTKHLSVEVHNLKEGESAPSESLVSPDKLYRAALLKSRFADTILKAQEKTLEKGEKRDPEKLRLDREELERRLREEKARLQAEAKAAEEARKKAEAEAAAKAKRKRELEREAARLALQKMEKTVDINENCQFMEDLELLRSAPTDDMLNFMDDAVPDDDSPDGRLGSFRLRGNSNPLEQLGLYMKDDDEEEEEVEAPPSAPGPASNDVEEGEID